MNPSRISLRSQGVWFIVGILATTLNVGISRTATQAIVKGTARPPLIVLAEFLVVAGTLCLGLFASGVWHEALGPLLAGAVTAYLAAVVVSAERLSSFPCAARSWASSALAERAPMLIWRGTLHPLGIPVGTGSCCPRRGVGQKGVRRSPVEEYKCALTQRGQDPALGVDHAVLGLRLVPRLPGSSGDDGTAEVGSHLGVGWGYGRLVAVDLADRGAEVCRAR